MVDFFIHNFLSSIAGVLGTAGILAIILFAVAWFIPPLRPYALAAIGAILAAATTYTKGNRDRAKLEERRKEEAVRKAREEYDKIDKRPDTVNDVADRLRKHDF